MEYISSLHKVYSLPEKRRISLLGSTGSIGVNTLKVVEKNPSLFQVIALGAGENIYRLVKQAKKFRPDYLCVKHEELILEIKELLPDDYHPKILWGQEGYNLLATLNDVDIVVQAQSGAAGLTSTIKAVEAGKVVALANKESLVLGGHLIKGLCRKTGAAILPIDSEHNAIFQIIMGQDQKEVRRIILTASGGPFFGKDKEFLENVTPDMALSHPNWAMGQKITIDSATLMNKGLEVIEAYYLYGVDISQIDVVIHKESIIHSMVEFCDGSTVAEMSLPDMKLPIAYCLTFPRRMKIRGEKLDLTKIQTLTFYPPDNKNFPMLNMAIEALKTGQSCVIALNAANEVAVDAFLGGKIKFLDIAKVNQMVLKRHKERDVSTLEDILEIDVSSRIMAQEIIRTL